MPYYFGASNTQAIGLERPMDKATLKAVIAPIVGVVVSGFVVAVLESAGHAVFPPPPGLDLTNPADLERLWDVVRPEAMLMVVTAWFFGALAGGCVAIAISHRVISAWIVGVIVAALGLWTTQMFPHPLWMVVSALVLPLLAVLVAKRLMRGRNAG